MARARQLKPSFFLDEDIAELSPWARLLFQALWTLADREGRLEDRPAFIRVQAFPYDDLERHNVSIGNLLAELAEERKHRPGAFITRYTVDGRSYIQVNAFTRHQKCHPREPGSEIPQAPAVTKKPRNYTARQCLVPAGQPESIPSESESMPSEGTEAPPPSAPVALVRKPWSAEAVDDWQERYGPATAAAGKILGGLSPLLKHYKWAEVRPAWQRYLRETTHPSPSAANFREQFGDWLHGPPARAAPKKPTVASQNLQLAARLLRSPDAQLGSVGRGDDEAGDSVQPNPRRERA